MSVTPRTKTLIKRTVANSQRIEGYSKASQTVHKQAIELMKTFNVKVSTKK
jgi:hypothetical protein